MTVALRRALATDQLCDAGLKMRRCREWQRVALSGLATPTGIPPASWLRFARGRARSGRRYPDMIDELGPTEGRWDYALFPRPRQVWSRPLGLAGVWGVMVEDWLNALLPPDADAICRNRVHLLVRGPSLACGVAPRLRPLG